MSLNLQSSMTSENTVTPSPSQPVPSQPPSQPPSRPSSSPSGIVESLTQKGPSIADTLIEKAKQLIFPSINGKRSGNSGFTYITISGSPQERGFSHGKLLGDRIIALF